MSVTRRQLFRGTAQAALVLSLGVPAAARRRMQHLRFGLCADVHQDLMHDTLERMGAFVSAMQEREVDFIAQMGDFCTPKEANRAFLEAFHAFEGPHYHVRGNHDTDGGFDAEAVRQFWGIESTTYAFEHGGVRFLVLDGNDRHADAAPGYARHVGAEQLTWLEEQLERDEAPLVVFSHQSLENGSGVDNGADVRALLDAANERAGWRRVLACFSGHHHLDDVVELAGVPYVQVNSMSYYWVGGSRRHQSYPAHIHAAHPWIEYTSPYREPLWSTVTIDPEAGELRIEGVRSEWVGPSPQELGLEPDANQRGISCSIADRHLELGSD